MQVKLNGKKYETQEFFHRKLPHALCAAQEYAGKAGFVADMPSIIRLIATHPNLRFGNTWHTTTTEEHCIPDTTGHFGKKGKPLVLVTHGHGIFTPQRITQAREQGLVNGAQLTPEECHGLLFSPRAITYEDFRACPCPRPYTIVLTKEQANAYDVGALSRTEFITNPRIISWAGGFTDYLDSYFTHEQDKDGTVSFFTDTITPENIPHGRLLFQYYHICKLLGDGYLYFYGNFFAGRPSMKPHATNLDITTPLQPPTARYHTAPPTIDTIIAPDQPVNINITLLDKRDATLVKTALITAALGIATAAVGIGALIYAATQRQPPRHYSDVNGDGVLDSVEGQRVILRKKE